MEKSARDFAIEYASDIRFHQSFTLPPNPQAGRPAPIRVTYADADHRHDKRSDGPTILCVGGMMGGRYMVSGSMDILAKRHGVRFLCVDRCGLGGSGNVALEHRVQSWLDTVPALLQHLDIKHVALISHSSGTMFSFNTLLYLRQVLHPSEPYVAMLAPWVHQSHSEVALLSATSIVPNALVSNVVPIIKFINNKLMPGIGPIASFSSGMLGSASTENPSDAPDGETKAMRKELGKVTMKYVFEENTEGPGQEAMFCIRRGPKDMWGPWEDYDKGVRMITEQEASLDTRKPNGERAKLRVHAFFAESDALIGKKGADWFDSCWKEGNKEGQILYTSETVPDTGHDSIVDLEKGVTERIFEEVVASFA